MAGKRVLPLRSTDSKAIKKVACKPRLLHTSHRGTPVHLCTYSMGNTWQWRTHGQKSTNHEHSTCHVCQYNEPKFLLNALIRLKYFLRQMRDFPQKASADSLTLVNLLTILLIKPHQPSKPFFQKSQQCEDCGVSSRMSLLHDMGSHPRGHAESSRMLCSLPASSWLSSSPSRYP